MDHLVGLVGKDFVLIAADRKVAFSVISVKTDQDKIMNFDKSKLLAVSGEVRPNSRNRACHFMHRVIALHITPAQLDPILASRSPACRITLIDPFVMDLRVAPSPCNVNSNHAMQGGDPMQFSEYIQKNCHLYQLRTGLPLSTHACANFTRGELAQGLRSSPFTVSPVRSPREYVTIRCESMSHATVSGVGIAGGL